MLARQIGFLSGIRRRSDSQCLIAGCFKILNNVNSVTKHFKVQFFLINYYLFFYFFIGGRGCEVYEHYKSMSHYFMAHNMKRESWGIALQFGIPRGGEKKEKKIGWR